ncbi:hypothetical protein CYMTET_42330 [Cymbomonas tetramitiformis]|uniref:Uncharacterized protein n=1 Tax=Cymbomonas tetramitiformis TaxID=36881 RepID=A0AAE0F2Q6_9CHLO|nr:hypothetical protein CYMTET_42330 [Cymbomonas tetramitiformis]
MKSRKLEERPTFRKCFNNQLATSSSDIVQMTYEDSDVFDEENLQEARRLDSEDGPPTRRSIFFCDPGRADGRWSR